MKPELLLSLRQSRGLTRDQLARELGGCTAQAIVKWERGERSIPAWVEEKMMRAIPVTLPLDELQLLLTEAQSTGIPADQIIAEALRLWLEKKTAGLKKIASQNESELIKPRAWHPKNPCAQTADSITPFHTSAPPTATANIVPLPTQHVVSPNETSSAAPTPERAGNLGLTPKPRRKRGA